MSPPKVILHTRVVTGAGGGPEKTILNSPRFLNGPRWHVLCAYMRHPADTGFALLEKRAAQWNAELVAIDDHGPLDRGVFTRFADLCERVKPDIWHGHDYKSNLIGLWLKKRFGFALVTTAHGWVKHTWKTPLYHAIDRYCLKRMDAVIGVSEDLAERCRKFGTPSERVHFIPNAIDTEEYKRRRSPAEAKQDFGLPSESISLCAVGRLSEEKGFHLLLPAVKRLVDAGHNLHLLIAGEGDQHERLTRLTNELGLADRVRLLGLIADPRPLYEASDGFVLSSLREGLPNVVLEAMALECPLVATRINGVPGLVTSSENGLVIEPGSIDELVVGLTQLVSDAGLRSRLASAARETIVSRYSFAERMRKVERIYKAVLAGQTLAIKAP